MRFSLYLTFSLIATVFLTQIAYNSEINGSWTIIRVVDWDTVIVDIHWTRESVRIAWIDTPEIGFNWKEAWCFWNEAKKQAKKLLDGKKILLHLDPLQADKDKYWRLLRYIEVDWKDFGWIMINGWYAINYSKISHYKQKEYWILENNAKKWGRWIWFFCIENNNTPTNPLENDSNKTITKLLTIIKWLLNLLIH